MLDESETNGIPATSIMEKGENDNPLALEGTRIWYDRNGEIVVEDEFIYYLDAMSVEAALSYVRTGHTAWVKREDTQTVLDALKGEE